MENSITAVFLVKNEEYFIKDAILSVEKIVDEIIVFDTGSTDLTLSKLNSIKSTKLKLFEVGHQTPENLQILRNKSFILAKSKWVWLVDGDEIYDGEAIKIPKILQELNENVFRVEILVTDFIRDLNIIYDRYMGKIFRKDTVKFVGIYPFETPILNSNNTNLVNFRLPQTIRCYHMSFFPRSSKDRDVNYGRHWRRLPIPIKMYFGPWPKSIEERFKPFSKFNFIVLVKFLYNYFLVLKDRIFRKFFGEHPSKSRH